MSRPTTQAATARQGRRLPRTLIGLLAALVLSVGCGKKDATGAIKVTTPKQAASSLEQAFAAANAEAQAAVKSAATGLREGNYEQAIVSLTTVQAQEHVTLDQGMAIHQTVLTLENQLVNAMAAGDPNAKRAYQLLRQLKRN